MPSDWSHVEEHLIFPEDAEIDVDKLVQMYSTKGLVTCRGTPYSMDIRGG